MWRLQLFYCVICQQRQKWIQTSRHQQRSSCSSCSSARAHAVIGTKVVTGRAGVTSVQVLYARRCWDFYPCTSDPRCSLCKAGWLWWRGRCYFFSMGLQENLTWKESARFCQQHNSSLVVIEDPAEMVTSARMCRWKCNDRILQTLIPSQDFLQCVMKKFRYFPFPWVGLTDTKEEGHWVWMDGSDLQHYMPWVLLISSLL